MLEDTNSLDAAHMDFFMCICNVFCLFLGAMDWLQLMIVALPRNFCDVFRRDIHFSSFRIFKH